MQTVFQAAYKQLNKQQQRAVDTTEGPVLVLAGPGTGKTQLLSTRAANIIAAGNVTAGNILCLTFTDSGAHEMRDRMVRIMGANGSDVTVHTFHSFGTWLISQYPEQFSQIRSFTPLDDLGRFRILESLLASLPFRHPFAVRGDTDQFIRQRDVADGIRAFKQAGLRPDDIRRVLDGNDKAFKTLQPLLDEIFGSTLSAKRLPAISESIAAQLQQATPGSYAAILLESLANAVTDSEEIGKTAPLGNWRTAHTINKDGQKILKSNAKSGEVRDLVDLYEQYQARLAEEAVYDYEDMILQATDVLERQADICLDIAERFQYIMVDEYQDTNGAQNRLLDTLLKANPLDSPNVLVVGDDDQAIMRFQGAEVSGMLRFIADYQPTIIPLTDNYRSSQSILNAARQIITRTDERLESMLANQQFSKALTARRSIPKTTVEHHVYVSPNAEYAAVADHVAALLKQGVPAKEIAVIGRKHPELALFVPFLNAHGITIAYDKRENILDDSHMLQLLDLATLIATLADSPKRAASLLPTILAAPYWQLPPLAVYQLAIVARQAGIDWLDTMLQSEDSALRDIAEWLIAASTAVKTENFTQLFDMLIGRSPLAGTKLGASPFAHYLGQEPPEQYVTLLSHLICLRAAVLRAQPNARGLQDLLDVVAEYRRSGTRLIDDNPVLRGSEDAVQVMSAHGAKGREFEHVIILSVVDTMWGPRARGPNTRIRLPENLPLYPAGDSDSDKLRLLYVAMTRAKSQLLLTSYQTTDAGKDVLPLSYLQLGSEEAGWWHGKPQPVALTTQQSLLETAWHPAPPPIALSLQEVLQPLLKDYRLSPSALRTFLDIRYGGPLACIEQHVLRFPSAYNAHSALGNATHDTLEKAYGAVMEGTPLSTRQIIATFDAALDSSGLQPTELDSVRRHGHEFLPRFIAQFELSELTASEKYFIAATPHDKVPIGGKVDALKGSGNSLEVIDYKTGKPPLPDWQTAGLSAGKQASQHFYRQQLLFYKLLIDNSSIYADGQGVAAAELIFVEPAADDAITPFVRLRIDSFEPAELERTEKLAKAVYDHLTAARLPDISGYSLDLKGIKAFEADLLNGTV